MAENITKNLWQVMKYDDLLYLLRQSEKGRHVTLCIVLRSTPDNIKSSIKKFLKDKSRIFPNVTFLYFIANKKDLGAIPNVVDKDESEYPVMRYIYNVKELLGSVYSIETTRDLQDGFKEIIENDYIIHRNLMAKREREQNNKQEEQLEELEEHQHQEQEEQQDEEIHEQTQQNANKQAKMAQMIQNQIKTQMETHQQNITDQKKFLDKLLLLKSKSESYQFDFAKDILKRKKEEEKSEKNDKSK